MFFLYHTHLFLVTLHDAMTPERLRLNPFKRNRFLNGPPGASKLVLRMFGIRIPERYPDDDRKVIRIFSSFRIRSGWATRVTAGAESRPK